MRKTAMLKVERQIYGTRVNVLTLMVWILIWFGFGFIYSLLNNVSNSLGWIFIIVTAGFFFYAGGHFVDEGAFNSVKWKIFFVLIGPVIFLVDLWLSSLVSWHKGVPGFAYYFLYTLGFLLKKIPRQSRMIQIMKQIEPGYKTWDDDEIIEQIKAIEGCGYKWYEKGGRAAFRHKTSKLFLNIPNLCFYTPENIIETYEKVWSKEKNIQA